MHSPAGSSDPGLFGSYEHSDSQGCCIATCIYGSYDCPQVWTLRRFRDRSLAATRLGRCFIRCYYTVSPTIVRRFGNTLWFQRLCRPALDTAVRKLNARGFDDAPYRDEI